MNHAAFDGYTCGLGDVLPDATDDEPSRHGAGEWRLKSCASTARQIGKDGCPPIAVFPKQAADPPDQNRAVVASGARKNDPATRQNLLCAEVVVYFIRFGDSALRSLWSQSASKPSRSRSPITCRTRSIASTMSVRRGAWGRWAIRIFARLRLRSLTAIAYADCRES